MSDNHTVSLRPTPSTVSPASTPPPQPSPQPRPRSRGKSIFVFILVALLAGALWWYVAPPQNSSTDDHSAVTPVASTTVPAQSLNSDDVIARVGALIDLPVGETPTIATVSDPSKLAGQAFFAKATKGDIVLIYTKAHEAYLYDPGQNKLIEVAPITTNTGAVAPPAQPVATSTGAVKK